jgi:hypothetical protein
VGTAFRRAMRTVIPVLLVMVGALTASVLGESPSVSAAAGSPPVVTAGGVAIYPENGAPVALDPGLTVSDAESPTLAGATVTVSNGFLSGDELDFTNEKGISGTYSPIAGVLDLSGVASVADYQAALESVSYSFSGDPTDGGIDYSRTISWTVSDGTAASVPVTSTLYLESSSTHIATSTSLVSADNPSRAGERVSFTATVSPVPFLGGSVAFTDEGTTISGCDSQPVSTLTGEAECSTTLATDGGYSIVAAYGGYGEIERSMSSTLDQAVISDPGPPEALAATPGVGQITLRWMAPSSDGDSSITGYLIFRGTTPGGEVATPLASSPSSSYIDTSAVPGITYYYTVEAVNAAGDGPASSEASTASSCDSPVINSASSTTATAGTPFSMTVTTCSPAVPIIKGSHLPKGLAQVNNHDGTATISGTPATKDSGTYTATITATVKHEPTASQSLVITIDNAPVFTSKAKHTVHTGVSFSYPITTRYGYPAPTITASSGLPGWVHLMDQGNGTAILAGTPEADAEGVYAITITADNGIGPEVDQTFILTCAGHR